MVDLYINKIRDEQIKDLFFRFGVKSSSPNHTVHSRYSWVSAQTGRALLNVPSQFKTRTIERLTLEEKSDYESRYSWTWIEAIYILNGFKPIFQTSTKPMLLRFSNEISYFSEALARGDIGKKIIKDGAVDYEDTVKNWMEFWRKYEWIKKHDDVLEDLNCGFGFDGKEINNIDWDFWRGLSQWTKEQTVYLLCGIEPHDADFEKIPKIIKDIQLKAFDDLKVEIAPPFVWLRWFNDSGMFGLENTSRELSVWYNEQLAEKELTGDLPLDD